MHEEFRRPQESTDLKSEVSGGELKAVEDPAGKIPQSRRRLPASD